MCLRFISQRSVLLKRTYSAYCYNNQGKDFEM
jgi:hypothetical protein